MMNEVKRSRQVLREAIWSEINVKDLTEHPNYSSILNGCVIVMPELVSCIHCWYFVLLVADCQRR